MALFWGIVIRAVCHLVTRRALVMRPAAGKRRSQALWRSWSAATPAASFRAWI